MTGMQQWGAERWPLAFQGQLCTGHSYWGTGSWLTGPGLAGFWLLLSLCFLGLHKSHRLLLPASSSKSVFIFQAPPILLPQHLRGHFCTCSLPASPWLSLFFFLFRAPSQTLLLSNAACAVSESLRLGTADGNKGQFLWCWNSGEWGEGGASSHWWLTTKKRCFSLLLLPMIECHREGNVCVYRCTHMHTGYAEVRGQPLVVFPLEPFIFPSLFSCMCVYVWYVCVYVWCAGVCLHTCLCGVHVCVCVFVYACEAGFPKLSQESCSTPLHPCHWGIGLQLKPELNQITSLAS